MKKLLKFVIILSISVNAQNLKSELGIIAGAVSMQTDYGKRGHFASNYANIGFGIGGVYYLSTNNIRKRWSDRASNLEHLRLRFELSYMKTNLIHRGKYTQGTSLNTLLYKALRGTSTIFNYGAQIEYTYFSISDKPYFNPYLSFGFLANTSKPKLESTIGNIEPSLIPTVYNDGIFLEKNNTSSLIFGLGTRMRPKNPNSNAIYLIDFRLQRFNSDTIEGLDPKISANKFNDWLLFLSLGYIFSIN